MNAKGAATITLMALALCIEGCSSVRNLFGLDDPPTTDLESVEVIAKQANQNTATRLDLVFAYEPAAAELLPASALKWFADKAAIHAAAPTAIKVRSLQMRPTDHIKAVELPSDADDAIAVRAYANYISKGGHAGLNLTQLTQAVIRLEPNVVRVSEQ